MQITKIHQFVIFGGSKPAGTSMPQQENPVFCITIVKKSKIAAKYEDFPTFCGDLLRFLSVNDYSHSTVAGGLEVMS